MKVTFALIKPHLVKNISALNHVLASIRKEFTIIDSKKVFVSDQLAEHFYAEHKERFFYNRLITFMSRYRAVYICNIVVTYNCSHFQWSFHSSNTLVRRRSHHKVEEFNGSC